MMNEDKWQMKWVMDMTWGLNGNENLSIMSFAKGLLHVNILVYLIEGDENPC
jgi:hypothetical protein